MAFTPYTSSIDTSGNLYVGQIDEVSLNASYYKGSVQFDGLTSYLQATVPTAISTSVFTVEFWVYPTSFTNNSFPGMFDIRTTATDASGFALYFQSTNLVLRVGGTNTTTAISGSGLALSTWSHVAVVRNAGNLVVYINGVSKITVANSTNFTRTLWQIGQTFDNYNFQGNIACFRVVIGTAVYTAGFTAPTTRLSAIANTQLLLPMTDTYDYIRDISTNGISVINNFVVTSQLDPFAALSTDPSSPPTVREYSTNLGLVQTSNYYDEVTNNSSYLGSLSFNGTSQYLSLSSTPFQFGTGNFTVEAWIYPTAYTSGAGATSIVHDNWATSPTYTVNQWQFGLGNAGQAYFVYTTSTSAYTTIGGGTASLNQWSHIAAVRNGTTITVYLNGVSVGSGTNSNTVGVVGSGTTSIGQQTGGSSHYYFAGYISNVRMVNGTAVYTGAFTPPTSPLMAITNTSLLLSTPNYSLDLIKDLSPNAYTVTNNGSVTSTSSNPFTPPIKQIFSTGQLRVKGSINEATIPSTAPSAGLPIIDGSLIMWLDPAVLPNVQSYYPGSTTISSLTNSTTVNSSYPTTTITNYVQPSLPSTNNTFRNTGYTGSTHNGYWMSQGAAVATGTYIRVANHSTTYTTPTLMTASCWAKAVGTTWASMTATRLMSTTNGGGWNLAVKDSGAPSPTTNFSGTVYAGGGYRYVTYPLASLDTGTWHHFVLTFDGRYVILYVDNSAVATTDIGTVGNTISLGSGDLFIMCETNGTTATGTTFNGAIGQCLIYNRALSSSEVTTLYNSRNSLYL
jgi:Concanavalin A-like lectin/glucanases superfamily